MPQYACAEGIWVGGLCVYLYVCNLDFSKIAKNEALANAIQARATISRF